MRCLSKCRVFFKYNFGFIVLLYLYTFLQSEKARRAIRLFFLMRNTALLLNGEIETQLPLTNPQSCVQIEQALDLSISRCVSQTLWIKQSLVSLVRCMFVVPIYSFNKPLDSWKCIHIWFIVKEIPLEIFKLWTACICCYFLYCVIS